MRPSSRLSSCANTSRRSAASYRKGHRLLKWSSELVEKNSEDAGSLMNSMEKFMPPAIDSSSAPSAAENLESRRNSVVEQGLYHADVSCEKCGVNFIGWQVVFKYILIFCPTPTFNFFDFEQKNCVRKHRTFFKNNTKLLIFVLYLSNGLNFSRVSTSWSKNVTISCRWLKKMWNVLD